MGRLFSYSAILTTFLHLRVWSAPNEERPVDAERHWATWSFPPIEPSRPCHAWGLLPKISIAYGKTLGEGIFDSNKKTRHPRWATR